MDQCKVGPSHLPSDDQIYIIFIYYLQILPENLVTATQSSLTTVPNWPYSSSSNPALFSKTQFNTWRVDKVHNSQSWNGRCIYTETARVHTRTHTYLYLHWDFWHSCVSSHGSSRDGKHFHTAISRLYSCSKHSFHPVTTRLLQSAHIYFPPVLLNGPLWTIFITQNPPLFTTASFREESIYIFLQRNSLMCGCFHWNRRSSGKLNKISCKQGHRPSAVLYIM